MAPDHHASASRAGSPGDSGGDAGSAVRALPRVVRFGAVGVVNTAIDFTTFAALYHLLHWPLLAANAVGFALAVANSYTMNKAWTFRDKTRPSLGDGARFFVVALAGLAIGSAVIVAAAQLMPALAAKVCAIGATFAWNYWASARFVFVGRAKA